MLMAGRTLAIPWPTALHKRDGFTATYVMSPLLTGPWRRRVPSHPSASPARVNAAKYRAMKQALWERHSSSARFWASCLSSTL